MSHLFLFFAGGSSVKDDSEVMWSEKENQPFATRF
jgi:hypothetical protein